MIIINIFLITVSALFAQNETRVLRPIITGTTSTCPIGYSMRVDAVTKKPYCFAESRNIPSNGADNVDFGSPSGPTSSSHQNPKETAAATKNTSFSQCESAYKKTQVTCNGQMIAPAVTAMLNSVAQMKSSGNIREACESAKKVSAINMAANAAFATTCRFAVKSCMTACNETKGSNDKGVSAKQMYSTCQGFEQNIVAGISQGIQDASVFAASSDCSSIASGKCVGQNALTDPDCGQFCLQSANASHPRCAQAQANCQNPTFYQQNFNMCQCMQNPSLPSCQNMRLPTANTNTQSVFDSIASGDSSFADGEEDFLGLERQGSSGGTESASSTSSGFQGGGGGSGSSAPLDSYGNNSEPQSQLDTDILTGMSNSAGGGGFSNYSPPTYQEQYEAQLKADKEAVANYQPKPGEVDLRDFLPGGKKYQRDLASIRAKEVSPMEGPSNFEKTSRMIRKLYNRGELYTGPTDAPDLPVEYFEKEHMLLDAFVKTQNLEEARKLVDKEYEIIKQQRLKEQQQQRSSQNQKNIQNINLPKQELSNPYLKNYAEDVGRENAKMMQNQRGIASVPQAVHNGNVQGQALQNQQNINGNSQQAMQAQPVQNRNVHNQPNQKQPVRNQAVQNVNSQRYNNINTKTQNSPQSLNNQQQRNSKTAQGSRAMQKPQNAVPSQVQRQNSPQRVPAQNNIQHRNPVQKPQSVPAQRTQIHNSNSAQKNNINRGQRMPASISNSQPTQGR